MISKKNTKAQAKPNDSVKPRIQIGKYMAITGANNYDQLSSYVYTAGCLKKDITFASEYFIGEGWAYGTVLKSSSNSRDCCHFFPIRQCAIIASINVDEAQMIYKTSKNMFLRDKWQENSRILAMALNAYMRSHPDTLNVFTPLKDFPISQPDEEEQKRALALWQHWKELCAKLPYEDSTQDLLTPLFAMPQFTTYLMSVEVLTVYKAIRDIYLLHNDMVFEPMGSVQNVMMFLERRLAEPLVKDEKGIVMSLYDDLVFYQLFLRQGDIARHLSMMHQGTMAHVLLLAVLALEEDRADTMLKPIEDCLKSRGIVCFDDILAQYIHGLILVRTDNEASRKRAETLRRRRRITNDVFAMPFRLLLEIAAHYDNDIKEWIKKEYVSARFNKMGMALFSLIVTNYHYSDKWTDTLKKYAKLTYDSGIWMLALELTATEPDGNMAKKLRSELNMLPLIPYAEKQEPWQIALNSITKRFGEVDDKKPERVKYKKVEMQRVSYLLDTNSYTITPRLQKSKDGGLTWSTGRNIALKTFSNGLPEMTPQDTRVAQQISSYSYGWYGNTTLCLGGAEAIEALIGHPNVYDYSNPNLKLEIQRGKLQIQVVESGSGYKVKYNVKEYAGTYNLINVIKESSQVINVITLTRDEIQILHLLDKAGIFPKRSKEQLTKVLDILGKRITIMSPLVSSAGNAEQRKGSARLTMQIVPYGDHFIARCYAKPLETHPPYCTPGKGLQYITTSVDGKNIQIERDLDSELKNQKLMNKLMQPYEEYETDNGWQIPAYTCLELMEMLRDHADICAIEWPEGARFRITRPTLNADSLHLSLKGIGHWFQMDGQIQISPTEQIKISELLQRLRQSQGRFIQLGDEEYVALSQQLHKQLCALERMVSTERKTIRVSSFGTAFIQDMASAGADISTDSKYAKTMKLIDEAQSKQFRVPSTLQADLRDYQREGFVWLSRLAHWGAGACLADDMGLGKTIQTIALLLARAGHGASLVVMPASVLLNWKSEIRRFAPALNPILLRDSADRQATVSQAGKNDVILATYGLLTTAEEILADKTWNIIVLDEAHTIKNKETKMSKAAMQLQGHFRLLLTGTPVQNHLSEIWNLFSFATPGLLSSHTQFTQQFITPIERDGDNDARRQLKRMLQPFILRRTKNDVLSELPQKTEITIEVELSPSERALYESYRQTAVLNLEEGSSNAIKALAELTRLRQLACNAALVLPPEEAKDIPSSKMEAFVRLAEQLMESGHRALVFSQFTSHLALVRKTLDERGIQYVYLDGSTTTTMRDRLVKEFQQGEAPLFLISLKAGGTGLNLTAADYVIHLDPWWNPAIEDQASDRAYRIGQDKPVTVYRLIATGTIEEKIIALHQTKKSLADALLEGSDVATALDRDEILKLIRGDEA